MHAKSYSHDYSGKYDCCDSQQTTATTPPTTYSSPQPGYVPGQFKLEVKPFPSARGQMPSRTSSDRSRMCFICCVRKGSGTRCGFTQHSLCLSRGAAHNHKHVQVRSWRAHFSACMSLRAMGLARSLPCACVRVCMCVRMQCSGRCLARPHQRANYGSR